MNVSSTSSPLSTARMRLYRARRNAGLLCLTLEVRETEIAALVTKGLLRSDSQYDGEAIRAALYTLLDRHLGGAM